MHVADFDRAFSVPNGIVAAAPISVGAALAAKIRGNTQVAVSFSATARSTRAPALRP